MHGGGPASLAPALGSWVGGAARKGLIHLWALQDMCLIEGALEVHLGEFHVKMKGERQSGWALVSVLPSSQESLLRVGGAGRSPRV